MPLTKAELKKCLDHLDNGVIVTPIIPHKTLGKRGSILYSNSIARQIVGYSEKEIKEKTIQDLFPSIALPEPDDIALDNLEPKIITAVKRNKTTTMIEYVMRHLVLQMPCCIFTIRDLAEFNLIRSKVMKMEEINTQLRQAFRKLKEKEGQLIQKERWVSIGQLAAGIAHEINNPLRFVQNNLFALDTYLKKFVTMITHYKHFVSKLEYSMYQPAVDDIHTHERKLRLQHTLTDIDTLFTQTHEGIHRITEILKSLKTFSQFERIENPIPCDLHDTLNNALMICENQYKHHVAIQLNLGDIPQILCNPGKISQVILNIIINAAQALENTKHHTPTHPTITITTHHDNTHIYCNIHDNGPGIPLHIQPKIFDPFFTTKDPKVGTGLGLSLSFDIIQKHNGELYMESTPGKGTTFTIKLPIPA